MLIEKLNSDTFVAMGDSNCDGYWYYDGSTIVIKSGRIIGGDGSHYERCRYKGEFVNGRAIIFGGVGSNWSPEYTEEWVLCGDVMVVDGGRYVWQR